MSLKDLYTDIILDHYRSPRKYGEMEEDFDVSADGSNPLCGDEIHLKLKFDDGNLSSFKWTGQGCAISQASTSMMATQLNEMTVDEMKELAGQFRAMMQGELDEEEIEELGDLQAVQGVVKFPVRIKCAVLAWNTLQKALVHADEKGAEVSYEEDMDEEEVPDEIPGNL